MENCQRSVKPVMRLPAALQALALEQGLELELEQEPTKALNRRRRHIRKELL